MLYRPDMLPVLEGRPPVELVDRLLPAPVEESRMVQGARMRRDRVIRIVRTEMGMGVNVQLIVAGVLALLGAAIHAVGGEVLVVRKLSPEMLPASQFGGPRSTKAMIHVTWQLTTVGFVALGVAALLAGAASRAMEATGLRWSPLAHPPASRRSSSDSGLPTRDRLDACSVITDPSCSPPPQRWGGGAPSERRWLGRSRHNVTTR